MKENVPEKRSKESTLLHKRAANAIIDFGGLDSGGRDEISNHTRSGICIMPNQYRVMLIPQATEIHRLAPIINEPYKFQAYTDLQTVKVLTRRRS